MSDINWDTTVKEALNCYHDLDALQRSTLGQKPLLMLSHARAAQALAAAGTLGLAIQRLIDQALHELNSWQPQMAGLLRLRFGFGRTGADLARSYAQIYLKTTGIPSATLHDHINRAISALADILKRYEAEAADESVARRRALFMALPAPTYEHFVGYGRHLDQVAEALNQSAWPAPPLFITGLGGTGKTSLIREALARWFRQGGVAVEQAAWVSVVQQQTSLLAGAPTPRFALDQVLSDLGRQLGVPVEALPNNDRRLQALKKRVIQQPTLIVIDNVETDAEAELALTIVESLAAVAQIAVTSRYRTVLSRGHMVTLHELPEEDALQLLAFEAERLQLASAQKDVLPEIYRTVGGNPHALKLIAAQLAYLPKEQVLSEFSGRSITARALFGHIYETAWTLLSPQAQDALLGLWMLPAAGADWRTLQDVLVSVGDDPTNLDIETVLHELVALNLVQVTPGMSHTYLLHRLTYHFIESKLGIASETGA